MTTTTTWPGQDYAGGAAYVITPQQQADAANKRASVMANPTAAGLQGQFLTMASANPAERQQLASQGWGYSDMLGWKHYDPNADNTRNEYW